MPHPESDPAPPTISVVIPVLDDAEHLRSCLAALSRQTRPADEVVVVDNNSIDDSAEVARSFGARVVYERIPGIPAASATGLDAATGTILARLDADCVPGPRWLERIEKKMAQHPEAAAVTGPATFHDGFAPLRFIGAFAYLGAYFAFVGLALGHPPLFGSNYAIRADAWRRIRTRVHRTDRDLHDDMDVSLHVEPTSTVVFVHSFDMRISARPFRSTRSLSLRFRRALYTLQQHWPDEGPGERLLLRARSAPLRRRARLRP